MFDGTWGDDIIDTRDVIEWIDEQDEDDEDTDLALVADAQRVIDEVGDAAKYGAALVRESYFEDYARELAEDVGAISGREEWPLTCIDWERAARELQMDYTAIEVAGFTYFVRA
jgi:hypothetical protein